MRGKDYLLNKLKEANIKDENVLGFYWNGNYTEDEFEECKLSEMPRLNTHDFIKVRCSQCGNPFRVRLTEIHDNKCKHCNMLWKWESNGTDYKSMLLSTFKDYDVIGYRVLLKDPIIECHDINKFPFKTELGCSSYIELRCDKCGKQFHLRFNHILDFNGCPKCNKLAHTLSITEAKNCNYKVGWTDTRFGSIHYWSSFELTFIKLIEAISDITVFNSQPKYPLVYLGVDNQEHSYLPDFYLEYKGKKYVIEIKPSHLIEETIVQLKLECALKYFKSTDIIYMIITEEELYSENPIDSIINRLLSEDKLKNEQERNI